MSRNGMARDQAVAAAVDLGRFRCVVDVGGGRGGLIRALLTADARLRGILFDLPSVVAGARETLSEAGLAERCDVVAGDFRQSVPRGGDAYVLSWILHDWDDEAAKAILRHCREAMDIGAALLVVEMIVPGLGDASPSRLRRRLFDDLSGKPTLRCWRWSEAVNARPRTLRRCSQPRVSR
jgi:predicted O-methyltransferase YrrM